MRGGSRLVSQRRTTSPGESPYPSHTGGVTDPQNPDPSYVKRDERDQLSRTRTVLTDPNVEETRKRNEARLQSILSFLETYGIPREVATPHVKKRFSLNV